jgi:hypothetical protein
MEAVSQGFKRERGGEEEAFKASLPPGARPRLSAEFPALIAEGAPASGCRGDGRPHGWQKVICRMWQSHRSDRASDMLSDEGQAAFVAMRLIVKHWQRSKNFCECARYRIKQPLRQEKMEVHRNSQSESTRQPRCVTRGLWVVFFSTEAKPLIAPGPSHCRDNGKGEDRDK